MRTALPLAVALLAASALPAFAQASLNTGSAAVQTATPANSSHSAGTSIGGLFSFPLARAPAGSGDVMQVLWTSTGGSTGAVLVRLWDAKPTNTTCTDNTAFVESAVDDQHLIAGPFSITPAAPSPTTGDTNTYASYQFIPPIPFRNQDTTAGNGVSPSKFVYGCFVAGATDTADENKAVYANAPALQD